MFIDLFFRPTPPLVGWSHLLEIVLGCATCHLQHLVMFLKQEGDLLWAIFPPQITALTAPHQVGCLSWLIKMPFISRAAMRPAPLGLVEWYMPHHKVTLFSTSISHHKKMITTIILLKSIFCKENLKRKNTFWQWHLHESTLILTLNVGH